MKAKEILKREFGADSQEIENEITERINEILEFGGDDEDVEEILMDYGLEMDYIFEFI
jgi:flagellar basal body-associated protein FliL